MSNFKWQMNLQWLNKEIENWIFGFSAEGGSAYGGNLDSVIWILSLNVKIIVLIFFMVFVVVGPVWSADLKMPASSDEPQQMEDFNIAGYGAKGEKTWEVKGATMDMVGNEIKISDITASLYSSEKNKENMVLTADHGQMDRQSGVVHLEDNVRAVTETGTQLNADTLDWSQKDQVITTPDKVNITKGNMTAVGTGIAAKSDMKVAKLEKDVVLTIVPDEKTKNTSSSAPKSSKMTITCDGPMELDYEKQFAVFLKNVKVEGDAEQGVMIADKMTICFNQETKQMDKMEAEGHVKIIRGENISYSDGAVFVAAEKRLLLTGKPKLVIFTEEGMNVSP